MRAGQPILLAHVVCAGVVACAQPAPVLPPALPLGGVIVRAHWDQACGDGRQGDAPVLITEVFDTVGLGDEVAGSSVLASYQRDRRASLDFVARYRADGGVHASGLWATSIDSLHAAEAVAMLRARVQPLPPLLQPLGVRTELTFFPTPRVAVGPPVICEPHIVHRDGSPPVGLPDSVRLFTGRALMRVGEDPMAELEVRLGRDGEVLSVERRRGSQATFESAALVMGGLQYDPALRNGEPVDRSLVQTVAFRAGSPRTERELDSLFLERRGYELRAGHFDAVVRRSVVEPSWEEDAGGLIRASGAQIEVRVGLPRVRVEGADCDAALFLNGVPLGPDPGSSGSEPPSIDPNTIGEGLIGLELYGPNAGVVVDPDGCGALLLWSRARAEEFDAFFVGDLEITVTGLEERERVDVFIEPVGWPAFRRGAQVYRSSRLLPGPYTVEVRRDGTLVGSITAVVTARTVSGVEFAVR